MVSKNILVNPVHIKSVVSLDGDDLGEPDKDGNVILVDQHIVESTGEKVEESIFLTVPADAYRDKQYLDWLLTDKSGESTLASDYNDLLYQQFEFFSKNGRLSGLNLLVAKLNVNNHLDTDVYVDYQLKNQDQQVESNLRVLQERYGKDYLQSLTDQEFYALYKKLNSHGLN